MEFYRCKHCGKIVLEIKETNVPLICCGEKMEKIVPASVDAAVEKHVPIFENKDNKIAVKVGSTEHPMLENHYIEWIAIETSSGFQIKYLKPSNKPEAVFALENGDKVSGVYAYCNLHGLWKA